MGVLVLRTLLLAGPANHHTLDQQAVHMLRTACEEAQHQRAQICTVTVQPHAPCHACGVGLVQAGIGTMFTGRNALVQALDQIIMSWVFHRSEVLINGECTITMPMGDTGMLGRIITTPSYLLTMRHHLLLLASLLLAACHRPTRSDDPNEFLRRHAESSLGPLVYLEGDSLWTIEERMDHYGVPGVSLAVIADGQVLWVKSYGVVDKETKQPVTDSTLFQAGSISKPVSAYGALRLAEQGLIRLNDDVNAQLRSWKLPENAFTQQRKVTPELLIGHLAGTNVHGFPGYAPDEPVPTLVQVLNGEAPANTPAIKVDKVPGESWRYSGGGYCILQQLMIDAKGMEFPPLMDELVLQPLGMRRSTYEQPLPADELPLAATGYLPDGSMTSGHRHTYPEMAAAGLWSTAGDLAKWVIDVQRSYQQGQGVVIGKASATLMLTPTTEPETGTGLFLQRNGGQIYFEHGGWDEGFCAQFIAHRDKGYGVVVMINANQPDFMWELIRSVARAYDWEGFIPNYTKLPMDAATLARVSGRYRTGAGEVCAVSHHDGRLFRSFNGGEPEELFRITDSTYIARADRRPVQFMPGTMLTLDREDRHVLSTDPRMGDDEHVPFEFVLEGKPEQAVAAYRAQKAAQPDEPTVQEAFLNNLGYELMNRGQVVPARDLFFVNIALYPASANVYDSYAEACLNNGEEALALTNYKKALAMNPDNGYAARVIKELEGKKVKE